MVGKGPGFLKIGARVLYREEDVELGRPSQVCQNTRGRCLGGVVMARFPSPNRIKMHYVYTVWEAAQALGRIARRSSVGSRTRAGCGSQPSAVADPGEDLKEFLGHRRAKSKTKLALHHLYCLGCKSSAGTGWKIRGIHASRRRPPACRKRSVRVAEASQQSRRSG